MPFWRKGFAHELFHNGLQTCGFIKAINPTPVSFSWGGDATEAAHRALAALEEQVRTV